MTDAEDEDPVAGFEATLASNPYAFEAHTGLIEYYRSMPGTTDVLRRARERFASALPLTEGAPQPPSCHPNASLLSLLWALKRPHVHILTCSLVDGVVE